jgi:hypothetical protein
MNQGSQSTVLVTQLLESKDLYAFVWGAVRYDDGYGEDRYTRFCHRYAIASHNRGLYLNRPADKAECLIDADKARYHETGNEAN